VALPLGEGVRRIVAPNASPMTHRGTNTYLLGRAQVAVIDPGPDDPRHLRAILKATDGGRSISHILITHAHRDHCALAGRLSEATGAKVHAYGTAQEGRSPRMQGLVARGILAEGAGSDGSFTPDMRVRHGQLLRGADWTLEVLHTPGHMGNHISLAWGACCFSGDHVMGWSTSVIAPPEGDLTDFLASCRLLQGRQWRCFFPGHGAPVLQPNARLAWLVAHRQQRESAILAQLSKGAQRASEIAQALYQDIPPALHHAALGNVMAHLIDLRAQGRVASVGSLNWDAVFRSLPQGEVPSLGGE